MNRSSVGAAVATLVFSLGSLAALAQSLGLPEPPPADRSTAARVVRAGNAAFLKGDLPLADADYRSALEHVPGSAIAAFNLGLVEVHEGRRARGLADMDRGIALGVRGNLDAQTLRYLRRLRAAFTPPA